MSTINNKISDRNANDEFDFQILQLTPQFFEAFPKRLYPEILNKCNRSYNCLLIQSHYNFFICIPYRSEITHNYAFKFKKSQRSKNHKSGLDYTKIIIINNSDYISAIDSPIDQDEYVETRNQIKRIKKEALLFVDDYISHIQKEKLLSPEEFNRRYQFSTLKYFHNELLSH